MPFFLVTLSILALLFLIISLLRVIPHLRVKRLSRLSNKHVWITGASQGLGLSLARVALRHGARVSLTARNESRLARAVADLGRHEAVAGIPGDVSDAGAMRAAKERAEYVHGPVDVLVANAGVNNGGLPFMSVTDDVVDAVVATNYLGVIRTFRACLSGMLSRQSGVLCAVGSLAGYRGVPGASVYGGTKAAVQVFCESLRVELVGSGVRALCVAPGFVETPAIEDLDHPKPFLVSSDFAAEVVLDACMSAWLFPGDTGLPWVMDNVIMRVSSAVPAGLYELILHVTGTHRGHDRDCGVKTGN